MQAFQVYPDKQVPLAVIRGTAGPAREAGFTNVIEMDAWKTTSCGPTTITALPGKHGVPEITYMRHMGGFMALGVRLALLASQKRKRTQQIVFCALAACRRERSSGHISRYPSACVLHNAGKFPILGVSESCLG